MKLESFKSFTYTANSSWEFLKKESKRLKTIITDKKLRETTYLCVEIMNSKRRTSEGETCSRGTNSRLPFDVNVMFNLSNTKLLITKGYRCGRQRSKVKTLCSNAVLCVSFTWQMVKTSVIRLQVIEGPNARDLAFCVFHSFLVEVQTNAGYTHATHA